MNTRHDRTPERNHTRPSEDGPFVWQSIAALERIVNEFDNSSGLAQALALYAVFTWCSREQRSSKFRARRRELAMRAGISVSMFDQIKKRFQDIGIIDWEQEKDLSRDLAPNTYSLLRMYGENDQLERPPKNGG